MLLMMSCCVTENWAESEAQVEFDAIVTFLPTNAHVASIVMFEPKAGDPPGKVKVGLDADVDTLYDVHELECCVKRIDRICGDEFTHEPHV